MISLELFLQSRDQVASSGPSPKVVAVRDQVWRDFAYLFQGPPAVRKIVKKQVAKFEKQTARPDRITTAGDPLKELNALYNKLTSQNASRVCQNIVQVYGKQPQPFSKDLLEIFWKHMMEQAAPANREEYKRLLETLITTFPKAGIQEWFNDHWSQACDPAYYLSMPSQSADDYSEFCEYRVWRKRHLHEILFWISLRKKDDLVALAKALETAGTTPELDTSLIDSLVEWFIQICKKQPGIDISLFRSHTAHLSNKIKFFWMELEEQRRPPPPRPALRSQPQKHSAASRS